MSKDVKSNNNDLNNNILKTNPSSPVKDGENKSIRIDGLINMSPYGMEQE